MFSIIVCLCYFLLYIVLSAIFELRLLITPANIFPHIEYLYPATNESTDCGHLRNQFISSSAHSDVYSIQHYVIKCVTDLRQVGGFLWVL